MPVVPHSRARGSVWLTTKSTGIAQLRQSGASKLLFPRTRSKEVTAVLLNTAGGITGGDRFQSQLICGAKCHLTVTTQAAERIYRALPGEVGRVDTTLKVEQGGQLNWLPQETIVFDHAALDRHLHIDLADGARCLIVEPLIFGRKAMGETVQQGHLTDCISVWRNGQRVFEDRTRLIGKISKDLSQPAVAKGMHAMASLILASPDAQMKLESMRAAVGDFGGVSAVRDDVVFARLLAPDGFELRKTLVPLLTELVGQPLPRTWTL